MPERIGRAGSFEHEFVRLWNAGWLDDFAGKRVLEIGPRHGVHSRQIAHYLHPSEFVMVQRPETHIKARDPEEWLPEVQSACNARLVMGDLIYLDTSAFEPFDLVWCCGVIYHNVEQFRMMRQLWELCAMDGGVVVEAEIVRNPKLRDLPIVQIFWPHTFHDKPTITHLPSVGALKAWMGMVGFDHIHEWQKVWPNKAGRALLTGRKHNTEIPYEFAKAAPRTDGVLKRRVDYAPGDKWRID